MSVTNRKPSRLEIPLVDLRAQYRGIREEIRSAMDAIVESAAFIGGKALGDFQESFALYCQSEHAVGVSSGTSAVHLALIGCGLKPGDEVITVPNTFIATTEAISQAGCTFRFVDVDDLGFTLDPAQLESALGPRTRAVMPVHLFGQVAEMEAIGTFARKHGLALVEDAAQAHGAEYRGRRAGSLGDVAGFSFYPGKNLGAYGDAGAITTSDPKVAEAIRLQVNHGRFTKYEHSVEGYNHRLDALQAAVLSVKLRHLDAWNDARRRVADAYRERLADVSEIILPQEQPGRRHVYHLFVIQTERRDELMKHLGARGVSTGVHYPIPLHLQPAYRHLEIPRGRYPVSERLAETFLSLPIYPEMGEEHIDAVVSGVRSFFSAGAGA